MELKVAEATVKTITPASIRAIPANSSAVFIFDGEISPYPTVVIVVIIK